MDPTTLPWIGSGTSDNASSARLEIKLTVDNIMDKLELDAEQEEEIMDDENDIQRLSPDHMVWGRKKRAIVMFDAPHIDNICVNAASAGVFFWFT